MGAQVPEFQLKAVASGREVSRAACAGKPLLLLFHDRAGIAAARAVHAQVRARYRADEVLAASVVHLRAVPRPLRSLAEQMMAAAYYDAAREMQPGLDPADYVIILPDWSGAVYRAFGIADGGKRPQSVLLDGGWRIQAQAHGQAIVPHTLAALEQLLGREAGDAPGARR